MRPTSEGRTGAASFWSPACIWCGSRPAENAGSWGWYFRLSVAGTAGARSDEAGPAATQQEGEEMPPTPAHGKVCYVEIPAADIDRSADFYAGVFGWRLRRRGDGRVAFDDATGGVSGTWVVGRRAGSEPGLLLYIMVDSVEETIEAIL